MGKVAQQQQIMHSPTGSKREMLREKTDLNWQWFEAKHDQHRQFQHAVGN
ncbi:hypothetical protein COLO4_06644 [Corchorus olitorius]|uniref:Uncharacterized protein n=1 Tax=Corchorus olitorius TaxID=93759 RepID=A0A1R3KME7_9ROSI|nr:hypothetical protein COLO4_06644 [Corchorus olitorius]